MKLTTFMCLVLGFCFSANAEDAVRAVDADTIEMNGVKYRLHGIDAPEKRQTCIVQGVEWACGQAASNWMAEHLKDKKLECKAKATDRYGRTVAVCYADGRSVNATVVREGWALAAPKYSKSYIRYQNEAEDKKLGIWESEFQTPYAYRHSR